MKPFLLFAVLGLACAPNREVVVDGPPAPVMPPESAPPVKRAVDPRVFASDHPQAVDCEASARALLEDSAEEAWIALTGCIEYSRFPLIRELTEEPWLSFLRSKPNGLSLLTRVIAARGGSIVRDLALLQSKRIPLFSLEAAMEQPEIYRGKHVLMRAKVSEIRMRKGAPTVMLTERAIGSFQYDVQEGRISRSTGGYSNGSNTAASGGARMTSTRFGNATVRGGYQSSSSSEGGSWSESGQVSRHYDNVAEETGRAALGVLKQADPFLQANKDFVLLTKFEGVRKTSSGEIGDDDQTIAILKVLTYHEPESYQVY
jgi:hypothetical protein